MSSLRAHKLRTFLTLLGIIIGVASVVIVGAAIQGFDTFTKETTIKVFGAEGYQIGQVLQGAGLSRRERLEKLKRNRQIRPDDYAFLRESTGTDIYYSPYRQRPTDIQYRGQTLENTTIIGVASVLAEIREVNLSDGRFFTEQEELNKVPVTVICDDVRSTFFTGTSPLGKAIRIGGFDFTVVGVQEKIGNFGGQSQDNCAFIPAGWFGRIYGSERTMILFARAKPESGLNIDQAVDLTRVALRTKFKTQPGRDDNFDTLTPDASRAFIDRILGLLSAAVVPITAISLVVGGIVIMNIMLVSVTERTREIGVRKSLGARQVDLMLQFLLEAVFMSLLGGAIGLAGAVLVAKIASAVSGMNVAVTWPYVLLAVLVSSAVGILSGWYPASRAAKLDPVEALRAD